VRFPGRSLGKSLSPRARKWLTVAILLLLAAPAPLSVVLRRTMLRTPPRRVLPFDPSIWRAEAGRLTPDNSRGLMVPGLLTAGRLAGLSEAEVRAQFGEPDCPAGPGGPFAGSARLAYWVGKVGTRKEREGEPAAPPGCLYLRLEGGRVVEWGVAKPSQAERE
jgi:hypothetical protein